MANPKMAELYAQMREYVNMEDELPFPQFTAYYQELMACLQADYQDLASEELIQAQGCCGILANNAQMRATRKDPNKKKFAKMAEKATFWQDAIKTRLTKDGLSAEEQEQKLQGLWEE
jgi:hypothetical protein